MEINHPKSEVGWEVTYSFPRAVTHNATALKSRNGRLSAAEGSWVLALELPLSFQRGWASSVLSRIGQRRQVQFGFEGFRHLRGQQLVEGHAVVGVHPVFPSPVVALGATGWRR